jgi:LysM repeat protein
VWGVVEKSELTEQIGNRFFYLHTVGRGNTFYSLAKVYGVTADEIKVANPGFGNSLKLGAVILIPKASQSTTETRSRISVSYDNYFFHVVKQGESLYGIAKIFSVKVEDLVTINKLKSTAISPGYHLKIPEVKLVQLPEKKEPQKPQQTKPQQLSYFEYTVKPKETLFSIAKRYGIGLETLKYINNLSSDYIRTGQIILIPKVVQDRQAQKDYIIHQVQAREGLYGIARKYGVAIYQIKAINPGLTDAIAMGQEILIPRVTNEKGFIEHRVVSRKERLSDIAREYEITMRNLKDLNPFAPKKLRRGETVNIPIDFIDKKEDDLITDEPIKEDRDLPIRADYTRNMHHVFNVALMLPLYLTDVDSLLDVERGEVLSKRDEVRAFRFLEFYEGAQIAVDSMRQLGMQLNFRVYDVSDNEMETALLLQDPTLRDMDLIVSLLFSRSFALVARFSKEYRIPLVNVLSKRKQIIYNNPYVFKISPKPEALYYKVADFVGENMSDYNTIIVRNNPYQLSNEYNLISRLLQEKVNTRSSFSNAFALQKIDEYMDGHQLTYLDTLRYELEKKEYAFVLDNMFEMPFDTTWVSNPVKTVVYSVDSLGGIMRKASLFRDNLVIALGSDEVFAIELFTKLNFVRDSLNIKVIGLPDWHSFMNLDVDYSQPFSLRVASDNFVDYNSADVKRFVAKFRSTYYKVPEVETYSFLGYDATFYFLQALFRFGDDLLKNITDFQIPLLQNQLRFEKQGRGGYENMYWNFYRQENYTYKLEK